MKSDLITIEGNNVLQIDQKPLDVKVSIFLYNLQQPTKKDKHKKILNNLECSCCITSFSCKHLCQTNPGV